MKLGFSFLILVLTGIILITGSTAQVGIGTSNPDASSGLDIHFTDKGLLPPRMTTSQRDAIINPADGLMIFNTTTGCPNYYFSGSWYESCGTPITNFICGTSTITFNYNGSSVTYGTVVSANNRCWLDRNLGATQVATTRTDPASIGHLFQWGRLDDGHQVRTSSTTTVLSSTDVPGHGYFIRVSANPFDWRSPQNNNLWQGVNGTNNPCPEGFRLPTQSEWDTERLSWSPVNAFGAFASPLKLPIGGYRDEFSGEVHNEGTYSQYWSSSVNDPMSMCLLFDLDSAWFAENDRAYGFSVRCIRD